jgi:hypothetical protein
MDPNDWTVRPLPDLGPAKTQLNDFTSFLTNNLLVHSQLICAQLVVRRPPAHRKLPQLKK